MHEWALAEAVPESAHAGTRITFFDEIKAKAAGQKRA